MILPAYINVNQTGIPTLSSLGVAVTTTQVAFDFNNHPNVGRPFRGLLIIRLAQAIPAGTARNPSCGLYFRRRKRSTSHDLQRRPRDGGGHSRNRCLHLLV